MSRWSSTDVGLIRWLPGTKPVGLVSYPRMINGDGTPKNQDWWKTLSRGDRAIFGGSGKNLIPTRNSNKLNTYLYRIWSIVVYFRRRKPSFDALAMASESFTRVVLLLIYFRNTSDNHLPAFWMTFGSTCWCESIVAYEVRTVRVPISEEFTPKVSSPIISVFERQSRRMNGISIDWKGILTLMDVKDQSKMVGKQLTVDCYSLT